MTDRGSSHPDARRGHGEGKDALIEAALELLSAHGHKITSRAVAERAGLTHGLIRHHFGSFSNLLQEAIRVLARRSAEDTLQGGDAPGFAVALVNNFDAEREKHKVLCEAALQGTRDPEMREIMQEAYGEYLVHTRAALERDGVDADEELASLVFAALDGLVIQQLLFLDRAPLQDGVARLQKLLEPLRREGPPVVAGTGLPSSSEGASR